MISIQERYGLANYNGDVGIEIEMEGHNLPQLIKGWKAVGDGSLNDGVEYVTRGPVKRGDIVQRLNTLDKAFKDEDAVRNPSVRCGVHIHVNVLDMSHTEVITFASLFYALENILVEWCGEHREGNLFCLRTSDAQGVHNDLRVAIDSVNLRPLFDDRLRYAALNWKPLTQYGSLEFRCLATPKFFGRVAIWARMLLHLKNESKAYANPADILAEMSGMSAKHFVRKIMGPYSRRLLWMYRDNSRLEDQLREGMYNAQDVIHMANWDEFEKENVYEYAMEKFPPPRPQRREFGVDVVAALPPGPQPFGVRAIQEDDEDEME